MSCLVWGAAGPGWSPSSGAGWNQCAAPPAASRVMRGPAGKAYLDDALRDGAELDREGVALLLQERVAHLGAFEALLHTRQRPAIVVPCPARPKGGCLAPASVRALRRRCCPRPRRPPYMRVGKMLRRAPVPDMVACPGRRRDARAPTRNCTARRRRRQQGGAARGRAASRASGGRGRRRQQRRTSGAAASSQPAKAESDDVIFLSITRHCMRGI